MIKPKEYEEDQERQIRNAWFPNHEAKTITPLDNLTIIDWREPDTGIFAVRYIIDRNRLLVSGDIGCAAYVWGQTICLDFLAGCGLSYFAEKCEASESGRDFMDWDEASAREGAEIMVKDYELPADSFEGASFYSESEYRDWLSAQSIKRLTDDFEAMSSLMESGRIIHPRCIGHWVGLKMAQAQLEAAIKV